MKKKQSAQGQPPRGGRAQNCSAMLKKALSRPGVREFMGVYGQWQERDKGLDSYRAATKESRQIITTDHANPS